MGVNFKLLECSNLVGLFSCVFVRDQEWVNVRSDWTHVDMVKTGLKGYHGNKVSKGDYWQLGCLCFSEPMLIITSVLFMFIHNSREESQLD